MECVLTLAELLLVTSADTQEDSVEQEVPRILDLPRQQAKYSDS